MRGDDTAERAFTRFVEETEPRLSYALAATYGVEVGAEATADALAWAWEPWEQVRVMDNPAGYLYRVGQSRARRYHRPRRLFPVLPRQDCRRRRPGGVVHRRRCLRDGYGVVYAGRDVISAAVSLRGFMTERQHGAIVEIGDGVYTYPVELVHTGTPFTIEMRITIEGDLVSRAEILSFEPVNG